jgi:hypothetical protein
MDLGHIMKSVVTLRGIAPLIVAAIYFMLPADQLHGPAGLFIAADEFTWATSPIGS